MTSDLTFQLVSVASRSMFLGVLTQLPSRWHDGVQEILTHQVEAVYSTSPTGFDTVQMNANEFVCDRDVMETSCVCVLRWRRLWWWRLLKHFSAYKQSGCVVA